MAGQYKQHSLGMSPVGSINANGTTFDFYLYPTAGGSDHYWIYAAFLPRTKINKSSGFDFTPYFKYLFDKKIIDPKDYVCTVELGTEVAIGSGETIISNYSVKVVKK